MIAVPQSVRGRTGALVAAGIAALFVLVLIAGLIALAFGGQSEQTTDAVHQLAVYRAEIAMRPELEAALEDLRAKAAATPGLIASDSIALAQAQLQDEVKSIVTDNQGEVRTAQIVPATSVDGFQVIAIQYDLAVPMAKLRDLTYAIETRTPYLFVDDADVTAQQDWQSGDPQPTNPMLDVRWTIRGYRWSGAK
jgi:general secretion pathway protein M